MKASIDIKTPAGQSLEGFPLNGDNYYLLNSFSIDYIHSEVWNGEVNKWLNLHPGDQITITILPSES